MVNQQQQKLCSKCKKMKSYAEFYRNNRTLDHYTYTCKNCIYNYQQNEDIIKKRREYMNTYTKNRRLNDAAFKMAQYLRNRLNRLLNARRDHLNIIIGCTPQYLRNHIESQFTDNMTWQNTSIDHILPVSMYNLKDPEEVKLCFNYKNLQPMLKIDNMHKGARLNDILPIGILD